MSLLLLELHKASYRGIDFLLDSCKTTEGRKTVSHEYPNQKARFVEDLGENLRIFEVKGTLTGPLYLANKRRLEDALNAKGIGIFRHPFYGDLNVVVTSFALTEDLTAVGEAHLEVTFAESNINIFPSPAANNQPKINQFVQAMVGEIGEFFGGNFTTQFGDNRIDAGDILTEFLDSMRKNATPAIAEDEDLNTFSGELKTFEDKLFVYIADPDTLSDNILSIMASYDNLGADAEDRLTLNSNLFGFGSDQIPFPVSTLKSREKQNNRDSINSTINGIALINSYNAAAQKTYQNDQELNEIATSLEENYQSFIANNNFTESLLSSLEEIRNEVDIYFADLRITIDKIITITTNPIPLTVLTYKYYGDLERREEILELNSILDPSLISGEIKILEEETA